LVAATAPGLVLLTVQKSARSWEEVTELDWESVKEEEMGLLLGGTTAAEMASGKALGWAQGWAAQLGHPRELGWAEQ
jgi:hypothetical protein